MSAKGEIDLLSRLANPDAAVITNIGESHMQDLGSREGIAEAKLEIINGLKEDGVLIYIGTNRFFKMHTAARRKRTVRERIMIISFRMSARVRKEPILQSKDRKHVFYSNTRQAQCDERHGCNCCRGLFWHRA